MRETHAPSRRRLGGPLYAGLLAIVCAVSVLLQLAAAPIHAGSHLDEARAATTKSACNAAVGHSHPDDADSSSLPDAGECAACQLMLQSGDGRVVAPADVLGVLPLSEMIRSPRKHPMPTRLAISDSPPRAPPVA